jgi:3'-phosphoadenosine 5'-phosphosulfate sulfotransferase (PAPS reductase)/FAD synthetase
MTTLGLPDTKYAIQTDPVVQEWLRDQSPVAIGVSGGKDSSAVAIATARYLDRIGHTGPRILIHSDLGVVEWEDSGPSCQRLAEFLQLPLVVVRRAKGGMMERWEQRWDDNVARYLALECVKVILPWSTPALRFCTSELKVSPICQDLKRRWPGRRILNVTGIRRDESSGRSKSPVSKANTSLTSAAAGTSGLNWHPIVDWSTEDVYDYLREVGFELHEGYRKYGMTRISCVFCIMQSEADKKASAGCEDNRETFLRMVRLEVASTFAFQGDQWLVDTAPELLGEELRQAVAEAKERAVARQKLEEWLPDHLLYSMGWPRAVPSRHEAEQIAAMRKGMLQLFGWHHQFGDAFVRPEAIIRRYEELLRESQARSAKSAAKEARRAQRMAGANAEEGE